MKTTNEAMRLFDELDSISENLRSDRRHFNLTLRKIRTWFNKELRADEILPKEFSEFIENDQSHLEILKMKYIWSRTI